VVPEKGQLHLGGPGERAASPRWSWRKVGKTSFQANVTFIDDLLEFVVSQNVIVTGMLSGRLPVLSRAQHRLKLVAAFLHPRVEITEPEYGVKP